MVTGTLVARPRRGIRNQTYNPGRGLAAQQLATRAYPIKPPGVGGWPNVPRGPHKVGETFAEVNPYRLDPHAIIQADVPFANIQHPGRVPDFRDYSQTPRSSNIPQIVDTTNADNYWIPAIGPFGGSQVDPQTGEVISTLEMQRRNRGMRPPDVINAKVLRAAMMPQGAAPSMTTNLPVPIEGNGLAIATPHEVDLSSNPLAIANSGGSDARRQSVSGVGDLPVNTPGTPYHTPPSTAGSEDDLPFAAPPPPPPPPTSLWQQIGNFTTDIAIDIMGGGIPVPVETSTGVPVTGTPRSGGPPSAAELQASRGGLRQTPQREARPVPALPGRPTESDIVEQRTRLRPTQTRTGSTSVGPLTPEQALLARALEKRRQGTGGNDDNDDNDEWYQQDNATHTPRPSSFASTGRHHPKTPGTTGAHGHRPRRGSRSGPSLTVVTTPLPGDVIAESETSRLSAEGARQAQTARSATSGPRSALIRDALGSAEGISPASHARSFY